MENASAQIEALRQEVAALREQLTRGDAQLLTCLVHAEAKILECQTDLAVLKDFATKQTAKCQTDIAALEATAKGEVVALWGRVRNLDSAVHEIRLFLWPVVEKLFPNMIKNYADVGEKFKAPGTYSEIKRR